MKIIRASNSGIAAGRDVNISIHVDGGKVDEAKILQSIAEGFEIPLDKAIPYGEALMRQLFGNQHLSELILAHQTLKELDRSRKYEQLSVTMRAASAHFAMIDQSASIISRALAQRSYGEAYHHLLQLLDSNFVPESVKREISFDAFLVGFLYLANSGKTKEIELLYIRATKDCFDALSPQMLCLVAEMQQEIATRQVESNGLYENLVVLERILQRPDIDVDSGLYAEILQALVCRRIGERGEIEFLNRSIDLHENLLERCGSRTIELRNNFGVALTRYYEGTGDTSYLTRAKSVLESVSPPVDGDLISEYQCYPKALNNLGNVSKQYYGQSGSVQTFLKGIECYLEAEKYWTEDLAPYEWAMLQKNKAELRLRFLEISGWDQEVLEKALSEIHESLRYRTLEQSPYQFYRSEEVRNRLEALSNQKGY